jgi:hypothetical protein
MSKLANRVKVTTSTIGSGSPITLGNPEDGFFDFTEAGISDGDTVRYVIEDGNNFEIGTGVFTASGTTLTRNPEETLVSGTADITSPSAITLSGASTVFVTASPRNFSYQTAMTLIYGV